MVNINDSSRQPEMFINDWLNEVETTLKVEEAIFIMVNGLLIDGGYDVGMRGIDHNIITSLAPRHLPHTSKWNFIHQNFGVVRLVPETKTALIGKDQPLTTIQYELIKRANYTIEEY